MTTKVELSTQVAELERQLEEAKRILAKVRKLTEAPNENAGGYPGTVGAIDTWVNFLCPEYLR